MATQCSRDWHSSPVNVSAIRNSLIFAVILSCALLACWGAEKFVRQDALLRLLHDAWIIQAVLVTAVVALIYRLQSDLAALAGLNAAQRSRLDAMVKLKSRRLWSLFFVIALSALLPRVAVVMTPIAQARLLHFAVVLMVMTALYCLYLPSMWNELRRFLTNLVAERERRERRQKELERLSAKQ